MQLNYHKEFLHSSEHLWAAVVTLGGGLAIGNGLGLLVGVAAYAIAWIYLPDFPFFKHKVDAKAEALTAAEMQEQAALFAERRDQMYSALRPEAKAGYNDLAGVCREIEEGAPGEADDSSFSRLEELMWTYLRLLTMEEAVTQFLQEANREDIDQQIGVTQADVDQLDKEAPEPGSSREKLLNSRRQVLEVLKQRKAAVADAASNLTLLQSEQERLGHQIRLLRAESVAAHNSDMLTARINASVETLSTTNSMLTQMSVYHEMVSDMPSRGERIGYGGEATRRRSSRAPA